MRHAEQNLLNFLVGHVTFINEIKTVLILLQYVNVDYVLTRFFFIQTVELMNSVTG